jgi:hypothetical protein
MPVMLFCSCDKVKKRNVGGFTWLVARKINMFDYREKAGAIEGTT